ncbi:MAG: hypothetical protein HWE30_02300 [Methylocystaceae bacterium]|nr:hypothetical protein [Methylocystaceae bacterium]
MKKISNTTQRGGRYHYKLTIPSDIRGDLPEHYEYDHGKKAKLKHHEHVRFTLGTSDPAMADILQQSHTAKLKAMFLAARPQPTIIRTMAAMDEQRLLDRIVNDIRSKRADPHRNPALLIIEAVKSHGDTIDPRYLTELQHKLLLATHADLANHTKTAALQNIIASKLSPRVDDPSQLEILASTLINNIGERPAYLTQPTIQDAINTFLDPKKGNKKRSNYSTLLRILEAHYADHPIGSVVRDDIYDIREIIHHLPYNWWRTDTSPKEQANKVLKIIADNDAIIAKNKKDGLKLETKPIPTLLKNDTAEKYIGQITQFFNWLTAEYGSKYNLSHPAIGIRGKTIGSKRTNLKQEQLIDLFTDWEPTRHNNWGWAPLLALFHGMRGNEIFSMATESVFLDVGDIWVIHLPHTKTDRPRWLPVHPKLIDWGFIEYVKLRKAAKEEMVFADVHTTETNNHYVGIPQKTMKEWMVERGIWNDKNKFHSYRHTFKFYANNNDNFREVDWKTVAGWGMKKDAAAKYADQIPPSVLLKGLKTQTFGIEHLIKPVSYKT